MTGPEDAPRVWVNWQEWGEEAVPGAHRFALLPNLVPGGLLSWPQKARHDDRVLAPLTRDLSGGLTCNSAGQDKANQACPSPSSPSSPPGAILEQLTLAMSGGTWHAILGRTRRMEFRISHLLPWSLTLHPRPPAPCPCPAHLVIKLPSCPAASKSTKPQRFL